MAFLYPEPAQCGSSIAISEPIITGLGSVSGPPNPIKLGNQLQRPTHRCSAMSSSIVDVKLYLLVLHTGPAIL